MWKWLDLRPHQWEFNNKSFAISAKTHHHSPTESLLYFWLAHWHFGCFIRQKQQSVIWTKQSETVNQPTIESELTNNWSSFESKFLLKQLSNLIFSMHSQLNCDWAFKFIFFPEWKTILCSAGLVEISTFTWKKNNPLLYFTGCTDCLPLTCNLFFDSFCWMF